MCKFYSALLEREISEPAPTFDSRREIRLFKAIRINDDIYLSIQASYAHYCKPQTTLPNLKAYTHWEVALYNEDNFISVSDVLPDFKSTAELGLYFDGSVHAYVPVDLVEELYLALTTKENV